MLASYGYDDDAAAAAAADDDDDDHHHHPNGIVWCWLRFDKIISYQYIILSFCGLHKLNLMNGMWVKLLISDYKIITFKTNVCYYRYMF